jgi:hypothetical protein
MGFDKTSNDPSIQHQPSPEVTPEKTPVETPERTGLYSSGAPKSGNSTPKQSDK